MRECRREIAPLDSYSAQRVVAGEPILFAVVEDPDRGDPLLHLPSRPLTQIPVQGVLAARKSRPEPEMLLSERLEPVAFLQRSALLDHSRVLCQGAQALVRLWRIDERLDENAAPFRRKLDHFVHPNRLLRCGKHGAPNEVCRVTSAERRRPFDDRLLIRCEAELEPTIPCRACHSPATSSTGFHPIVRHKAVQSTLRLRLRSSALQHAPASGCRLSAFQHSQALADML